MDISNVLILAVGIIVLLCFAVFVIEMFMPLQLKLGVHEICRPYLYILEAQGDLDELSIQKIKSNLTNIGLTSVQVDLSRSGDKFGDSVILKVKGLYHHEPMVRLFKRKSETLEFYYEKKISVRKIIN